MRLIRFFPTLLVALLCPTLIPFASAQEFRPELDQASEVIAGVRPQRPEIPADAWERTAYPLPGERPLQLLVEIPGEPFRKVEPPPREAIWWKYPIYAVIGFPRDLVDSIFGVLSNVPIVSPLAVLPAYEIVPTQVFLRDPRDWHAWPGTRNRRGHGMIDSVSWGWFPSAHTWEFSRVSESRLKEHESFNAQLQERLRAMNGEIERENQALTNQRLAARRSALAAVEAGDGREAVARILPLRLTSTLDEGAFALFATSLALYAPNGPEWVAPLLWDEIGSAQAHQLTRAERLLAETAGRFPDHSGVGIALVYTRLLLGMTDEALAIAQQLLKLQPANPYNQRLVFECALAARQPPPAREQAAALGSEEPSAPEAGLTQLRLRLLEGERAEVGAGLEAMLEADPANAYVLYYLGCVELERAENELAGVETINRAVERLQAAALIAPGPALHLRASKALSFARGVLSEAAESTESFEAPAIPPAEPIP